MVEETTTKAGKERSPCNMSIKFNLGMYEYLNRNFGKEMMENEIVEIVGIEALVGSEAESNLFSGALVEYQCIVTFKVNDKEFKVHLTMYIV